MTDKLEVGMKLHALYSDGEFYPAEVLAVSEAQKRKKAPVKVHYVGYGEADDAWLPLTSLKSKKLPKAEKAEPAGKAKAKAKAKAKPEYNYSGMSTGLKLQVESDGVYYAAQVVTLATSTKRASAPVKINYVGYTSASDEWVGGDRIRSKALKTKGKTKTVKTSKLPGMPPAARKYLLVKPKVPAPLDPKFSPLVLGKRAYLEAVKDCTDELHWALPRADGCARYTLKVFPESHKDVRCSTYLAGVLIQEMIWQRSASKLLLVGPAKIVRELKRAYSEGGRYEFEVKSMPNVCGTPATPFEVEILDSVDSLPEVSDTLQSCGTNANGCRLAFDLGKSDVKTVAVKDNEVLDSKETEWDVTNEDPSYHFDMIVSCLKEAKAKLPEVQAIGGSATGTIGADNAATWCDIFPNVPPDVYKEKVVNIFNRIRDELAPGVPLKVINDGEVTALAAVKKIEAGNVMGISMGSSEGAGYANKDGKLMGWINELCYVKLDMNPRAPTDPWTKGMHTGISHMYLGQRGATKLAGKAGIEIPDNFKFPHADMTNMKHENHAKCLKLIQKAMEDPETEPKARQIYETCGVYLGYALAQYVEFYPIDHIMILGRVSKGAGGDIMLDTAKKVLTEEFPDVPPIQIHTADDHFKGVGQCIAAAALPELK